MHVYLDDLLSDCRLVEHTYYFNSLARKIYNFLKLEKRLQQKFMTE